MRTGCWADRPVERSQKLFLQVRIRRKEKKVLGLGTFSFCFDFLKVKEAKGVGVLKTTANNQPLKNSIDKLILSNKIC